MRWRPLIVGVEKGHILAAGLGYTAIACSADTEIGLRDDTKVVNAKVIGCSSGNIGASVSRPVIDHDNLTPD